MMRTLRRVSESLVLGSLLSFLATSCGQEAPEQGLPANAAAAAESPVPDPLMVRPVDRLTAKIDILDRVALAGSRHPLARAEFESGPAASDYRMERMMLVLRPDSVQEQALQALVLSQHDPNSPLYHKWLTPETYAERFGISDNDVAAVTNWLRDNGMSIEEVASGGRVLQFTGTAAQVAAAFHTPIREYHVAGEIHHANASDPEIPRALAAAISGVVSLHDFRSHPALVVRKLTQSGNTSYYNGIQQSALVPQDLAKIYNVNPLYVTSLDGTGQSIAVIGRSNIAVANVRTFRTNFGLPANDPQIILNGKDPGIICGGDEAEAHLDVEWAGALAKKATVKFVVSASTAASDGIYIASQYAVNNNLAPVISLSYGLCEKSVGTAGNQMLNSLWQQAATQGMSVFVASMDSGAAGCDEMNEAVATQGLGVNGLASTPFNTAVGGTQFDDVLNRGTYWSATNDPTTQASALSYIPELTWNESASGLYASGGGVSTLYPKPTWQFGLGVASDSKRDLPDVAMAAAIQDAYKIYADNQLMGVGGTSAATPVFASIMALVLQKVGQRQGLVNPVLYALAYNQNYSGGAAVFHDVTKGTNTVPGVTGYNAGAGYDMATGLGSVDATLLVNHWLEGTTRPDFQLAATTTAVSVLSGASTTAGFAVKANNGFNTTVSFSVTGLPAGVTSVFAPTSVASSGGTTLTLTASASAASGSYTLNVVGTAGSNKRTVPLSLTVVNAPPLSLSLAPSSIDVAAGASGSTTITTTRNAAFNSAVSLSLSGLPQGVTAKFSSATIAAPGAGTSVLTATVSASMAGGTYAVTLTATGGGVSKTALVAINVLPAPSFSLTLSPTALSVAPGNTGTTWATTIRTTTFNSTISVKVTGAPSGVTTSTGTIALPGSGVCALGVTVGSSVAAGSYNLTVSATGGGVTKTATLTLSVPGLSLISSATSLSLSRGNTSTATLTTAVLGGLSSAVTFSVQGLPAGVTATFTPSSLAAPGKGSTVLKLSATSTAATGTATLIAQASAGSVVATVNLKVVVK
jgi:pseudomonalisin